MKHLIMIILAFTCLSCTTNNKKTSDQSGHYIDSSALRSNPNPSEYQFGKTAILSGRLESLRYSSVGEVWFDTHLLILDTAINVAGNNSEYTAVTNVREVQVGFDTDSVPNPDIYLDKIITVTGTLSDEQTVHHRRPVIMGVTKVLK